MYIVYEYSHEVYAHNLNFLEYHDMRIYSAGFHMQHVGRCLITSAMQFSLYGVPFRPLRHVVAAVRTLWSDQDTQCSVFIAGY